MIYRRMELDRTRNGPSLARLAGNSRRGDLASRLSPLMMHFGLRRAAASLRHRVWALTMGGLLLRARCCARYCRSCLCR